MSQTALKRIGVAFFGIFVWFVPPPEGLSFQAWHLFAIFIAAIAAVVSGALPILAAAVLAAGSGSHPDETRRRVGAYLMMNGIAGLTISSALWLTAMAANPAGAAIARDAGIEITFASWLAASSVPSAAALAIFIWFAILYALSTWLNQLGFMSYVGSRLAMQLDGLSWPVAYTALVTIYVAIHYLFVSQTAHMLALYGIFLNVGITAGVPANVIAYMLLFATNFFAAITPQASSANVIFAGSGYLTQGEIYKLGGAVNAANLFIYLALGTPWLLLLA